MWGRKLCLVLLFILLSTGASALTIGISPGYLNFPNMVRDGYAQGRIVISSSSPEELRGHFEAQGDYADWIEFPDDDKEFVVSKSKPFIINIKVRPPIDTRTGNYTVIFRAQTDSLASVETGAGSSVIAAVATRINIEVSDVETIACSAGAFAITSTEVDTPFSVYANVENTGNVRLRPQVFIDVWDQYQRNIMQSSSFFGSEILPTTKIRISDTVEHSLPVGQYFAEILIKECGIKRILTFDVVGRGGIADTGEFIGIRTNRYSSIDEPTPFRPVFRNTAKRPVLAKFTGNIINMETGKIYKVIESDELSIEPGQMFEFDMYFIPDKAGKYQISGRIKYNNKITFEEKSAVIEVLAGKVPRSNVILYVILYSIIGLLILILLGKIKKGKKRKY